MTTKNAWWQRPGIGISYTVEHRPGWAWDRNYKKYNAQLMGENGKLNFDGPLLKVDQFVDLTKEVDADYHMLYSKWHDGICYFDTKLTDWKTPDDYMDAFSKLSKAAGIPFMIYYSNIFDHNPQFDHIQPIKWSTFSYIRDPEYLRYLEGQYRELVEQYEPDGLWFDWYAGKGNQRTVTTTIDFVRQNYPDVVLGFNSSSPHESAAERLDYTTQEFHTLGSSQPEADGYTRIKPKFLANMMVRLLFRIEGSTNSWQKANQFRRDFRHPWSGITPVGKGWQEPALRSDTNDLLRIAAVIMACGGRNTMQVNIEMDGRVFENHAQQMRVVGDWYSARKHLFRDSNPMSYEGDTAPGVGGLPAGYKSIASRLGDDVLIHIVKIEGSEVPSSIEINNDEWPNLKAVYLEPGHRLLDVRHGDTRSGIWLEPSEIDPVDTILRLVFE